MQISSDRPYPVPSLAVPPAIQEAGERSERTPDNEAAEAAPSQAPLRQGQGTKIDLTA